MCPLQDNTKFPFESAARIISSIFLFIFIFSGCTYPPQQVQSELLPVPIEDRLLSGTFMGPDGQPLPFKYEHEVINFLKTARIEGEENISTGVTKPRKLLLTQNGVQVHAVFHYTDYVSPKETLKDGQVIFYFRDSYLNQVAAYEMSRLLGMFNVPPTVMRKVNDQEGSVQLWIENAVNEYERREKGLFPPDRSMIDLRAHDMRVFDNLINNIDRNLTNILYDPNWKLWLIDHTRAFGRNRNLPDEKRLRKCSRSLWKKLQSLDGKSVDEIMRPYMGRVEITRIFDRRDEIVKHFKEKMKKEGEENVLFTYPES